MTLFEVAMRIRAESIALAEPGWYLVRDRLGLHVVHRDQLAEMTKAPPPSEEDSGGTFAGLR